ncbi:MAG: putative efflux protein [Anaerocolumna sp.]|jgi:threonine/homoserine/homoserine lactone efflux protein|nr:putative efflux protein [Anaerocolumna sp.]
MIFKGFKFGMLLQFAVGPMCCMVFNTSASHGFLTAVTLVIAIALVDGLYIALSGLGVAAVLNKNQVKISIKVIGCVVLVLFGLNTTLGVFDYTFLPNIAIFKEVSSKNIFIQGLLLTASNPLTIIFWSGVLSTQVIEKELNRKEIFLFGIGCVFSTLAFLTVVAFSGSILSTFLPEIVISILNFIVGFLLIFFGIKLLYKK